MHYKVTDLFDMYDFYINFIIIRVNVKIIVL